MKSMITSVGVYFPERVLTNQELETMVDTSDEWIRSRTGIQQRHILEESETPATDMGSIAAQRALEKAGVSAAEVDGIIVGTLNPDKQFPATACMIQAKIGATNAFAYDITAACSGFVFGLNQADLFIRSGQCKNVLVIGSEPLSPVVDWKDRNTCILFGDAAGAVLVQATGSGTSGIIASSLQSDGRAADILYLDNTNSNENKATIQMEGKQVYKWAVDTLARSVLDTLEREGLRPEEIALVIPHQANIRILKAVAQKLSLPSEKWIANVQRFGNTSSASIPLALHDAVTDGRLSRGDLVAFCAIGGGLSWGCNLLRW